MFEITIKTSGAAFFNPHTGCSSDIDRAMELVRILETQIIPYLKSGVVRANLRDINGNEVGQMRLD